MLLFVHIVFALASPALLLIAVASRLRGHSLLAGKLVQTTAATTTVMLVSGTALVLSIHKPLLGACVQGLAYLSILGVLYLAYKMSPAL